MADAPASCMRFKMPSMLARGHFPGCFLHGWSSGDGNTTANTYLQEMPRCDPPTHKKQRQQQHTGNSVSIKVHENGGGGHDNQAPFASAQQTYGKVSVCVRNHVHVHTDVHRVNAYNTPQTAQLVSLESVPRDTQGTSNTHNALPCLQGSSQSRRQTA